MALNSVKAYLKQCREIFAGAVGVECPATSVRKQMVDVLWHGQDPLSNVVLDRRLVDHQGWNSHHRYLARAIDETQPKIVVEVGVWKGGSVITLAERLRASNADAVVIAIDTWLGSSEHWTDASFHREIFGGSAYPKLYSCFLNNIFDKNVQGYVLPMPLDSSNACNVLTRMGIRPDIVHIDAGHDFASASSDLASWWPLLKGGGVLIGDDYFADGSVWPEVKRAFDTFFGYNTAVVFESDDAKCYVLKPI